MAMGGKVTVTPLVDHCRIVTGSLILLKTISTLPGSSPRKLPGNVNVEPAGTVGSSLSGAVGPNATVAGGAARCTTVIGSTIVRTAGA
jgi:hypothetical protein